MSKFGIITIIVCILVLGGIGFGFYINRGGYIQPPWPVVPDEKKSELISAPEPISSSSVSLPSPSPQLPPSAPVPVTKLPPSPLPLPVPMSPQPQPSPQPLPIAPPPEPPAPPREPQEFIVKIYSNTRVEPANLTIRVGDTVTIINEDDELHWPGADPHPTHSSLPAFDALGGISQGQSYSYTFTKSGAYGYHEHLLDNPPTYGVITVLP